MPVSHRVIDVFAAQPSSFVGRILHPWPTKRFSTMQCLVIRGSIISQSDLDVTPCLAEASWTSSLSPLHGAVDMRRPHHCGYLHPKYSGVSILPITDDPTRAYWIEQSPFNLASRARPAFQSHCRFCHIDMDRFSPLKDHSRKEKQIRVPAM